MNEVDSYIASAVGFVWDAKPIFSTIGIRARIMISILYNMNEVIFFAYFCFRIIVQ